MEDGQNIVGSSLLVGGIGTKSPELAVSQALEAAGVTWDDLSATAATGYGRNRYENADYNVSELSCHGLGAHHIFPTVRTIIDIGGQDAKVISLDEKGRMNNFLMNDKCAAGTGRFLDVMANILVVPVDRGHMQQRGSPRGKSGKAHQYSSGCLYERRRCAERRRQKCSVAEYRAANIILSQSPVIRSDRRSAVCISETS